MVSTITLDFKGIRTYWELHELFKNTFHLPDYYGHNLDALWDCLYCCYNNETTIVLKNLSDIPAELSPEIKILLELFQELKEKDGVVINIDNNDITPAVLSDFII